MEHIKIPSHFIKLIENSLTNCTNRVITDIEFTDEYKMLNGINQGEIMLPLLWIIYYDPVFSKIKNVPGLGYTINHSWVKNWALNENKNLQIEIFNIAFMDDTTWVADSKQHISEQL